ncbi:MAG: formyltransferase family protein, partial [Kiritimatiellia bacterium]|nr:formyltransferase family protein [Kiritimatiellia bacterium]
LAYHLARNFLCPEDEVRRRAYAAREKPVWMLPSIQSPDALRLVMENGFDLIVNARTRWIYKREILGAPPLGCINVHHGLLPEQRGTMCDLWALHERSEAGFSIHIMTPEVDAGPILIRVGVSEPDELDYIRYLKKACGLEREAVARVLEEIERTGCLPGRPNIAPAVLAIRKNPTARQIGEMRRGGLKL